MKKNRIVKKVVSKIVFAGLLISSLPVTLPVRAGQPPIMRDTKQLSPKLSNEEIGNRFIKIKKTINAFKIANVIVPIIVMGAGTAVFLVAAGVALVTFPNLFDAILQALVGKSESEVKRTSGLFFVSSESGEKRLKKIVEVGAGYKQTPMGLKKLLFLPWLISIAFLFITPITTFLSAIGLSVATMVTAFRMAGELERMEKDHPGTLTVKKKLILVQLKNLAKDPITRGIMKGLALKEAQNRIAGAVMGDAALGSKISFGNPKKALEAIKKYLKRKWEVENARKTVAKLAKETNPDMQRIYKKSVKQLNKMKQKLAILVRKYPYLEKAPELKEAVSEFRRQADHILEGLKKPVIEDEKLKPVVVPL